MRFLLFALTLIVVSASVLATSDEILSPEEQLGIVQNYLYVMGHRTAPSAAAAEDMEEVGRPPLKCGMSAVADFVMNRDRIDHGLLASLGADSLQKRPVLSDSFATPSGHFLIHYTKTGADAVLRPSQDSDGDGTPDYIETMGIIADSVYQRIVVDMSYPAPPSDGFYPEGGDDKFDIFVKNIGAAYFGLTYLDSINLGGADSLKATAFMLLDNDYASLAGYQNRPFDAIRVTMAHEYFHAVQFGIDVTEQEFPRPPQVGRYWMEMSATWMEEQLYDDINDYYNYLPYFFFVPTRSIQQFENLGDNHPYGSVVLPIFLTEKFGPEIIRDIWLRCGDNGVDGYSHFGPSFLQAAQAAIDSVSNHEQNWFSMFREFALWNYFTGERAVLAPNNLGYPEKANYPAIPDSTLLLSGWHQNYMINTKYPITVTTNEYPEDVRPDHNAMALIRMERIGQTEWRYMACGQNINTDTLCVLQYHDSTCNFETEIPLGLINQHCVLGEPACSLRTDCSSTTLVRIDSTLELYGALDTLAPVWGLSVIMEHWQNPDSGIALDSIVIDSFLLVRPFPNPYFLFAFATSTIHAERFKAITLILTPATNDYRRYHHGNPMQMAYTILDSLLPFQPLVGKPAAILTPFPNPSVVAEMHGQNLRFRFQVQLDDFSFPPTAEPKVAIDIFNVAGEYLTTIQQVIPIADRAGIWESEWDMTNSAGKPVASGVYLCIARLLADAKSDSPLVQSTAKVLIVR